MKTLVESLFDKDIVKNDILYHPETKGELINCIEEQLKIQGPDANLNIIDISKITDMSYLFAHLSNIIKNIDISKWDVSKVEDMGYMFYNCKTFNSDLSKWNVSKVQDTNCMFYNCEAFNADLSKWNVRRVEFMNFMFYNCKTFNSDLSKWNVRRVVDTGNGMFNGCKSLKRLPDWFMRWEFEKLRVG
jgi:surface protein